jgi:hypothetical protein
MVDRPTLKVEVGFAATALGSVTTWTDISSFVRSGSTNVGRSSEVDDYAAGSLSLTLDNRARTFDPFYTSGPYYGNLNARKQIRVSATYASVNYPLFYGNVTGWPLAPDVSGDSVVQLQAFDGLAYLATCDLPQDVYTYTVDLITATLGNRQAWWPLGSTNVNVSDREETYPFTFTTPEPRTGSAPNDFVAGSSQAFDGTFGAIGPVINSAGAWSAAFLFKTATAGPAGGINPILASSGATDPVTIGIDELGRIAFRRGTGNTGNSGFAGNDDNWHAVVLTYAGSGAINIYVDGFLLSSGNTTGTGTDGTGFDMIGLSNATTDLPAYIGELSNVTIWHAEVDETMVHQLAAAALFGTPYAENATDGWVALVLDAAGWPSGSRTLDSGTVKPGGMKWGTNALDVLQLLARTENGRVYVEPDGTFVFQDGSWARTASNSITSQATFSDSGVALTVPFSSVGSIVYSDEYMANRITVTTVDGQGFTADNTTSQTAYGIKSRSVETLLVNPSDAQTLASILLAQHGTPELRIDNWTVLPQTSGSVSFPEVLSLALMDLVTFEIKPNNVGTRISQTMLIESIAHNFTPDTWSTTFIGSPAQPVWKLEDVTYGVLESTTFLG